MSCAAAASVVRRSQPIYAGGERVAGGLSVHSIWKGVIKSWPSSSGGGGGYLKLKWSEIEKPTLVLNRRLYLI